MLWDQLHFPWICLNSLTKYLKYSSHLAWVLLSVIISRAQKWISDGFLVPGCGEHSLALWVLHDGNRHLMELIGGVAAFNEEKSSILRTTVDTTTSAFDNSFLSNLDIVFFSPYLSLPHPVTIAVLPTKSIESSEGRQIGTICGFLKENNPDCP